MNSATNTLLRSPLFYVGDKFKLIKEIRSYFPERIDSFFEPFVGGGSVFLNTTARNYVLNDIDKNVIALHKYLCSNANNPELFFKKCYQLINHYGFSCSSQNIVVPEQIKHTYVKTYFAKYNKEAYLRLRDNYNSSPRRSLLELYLLLVYGFNHMIRFNSNNDFNLPVGNVDFNNNVEKALHGYFNAVLSKNIIWKNQDFRVFLDSVNPTNNDLIYLDPPYLITFSEYNKLWTEKEEKDLLIMIDNLHHQNIRFAISNVTHYKGKINTLFLDWAKKYNSHKIKSNYISYHDNSIKQFQEVLVTNY